MTNSQPNLAAGFNRPQIQNNPISGTQGAPSNFQPNVQPSVQFQAPRGPATGAPAHHFPEQAPVYQTHSGYNGPPPHQGGVHNGPGPVAVVAVATVADTITIFGQTIGKRTAYIIGAILLLIVGYYVYKWYQKKNTTPEQEDDDEDETGYQQMMQQGPQQMQRLQQLQQMQQMQQLQQMQAAQAARAQAQQQGLDQQGLGQMQGQQQGQGQGQQQGQGQGQGQMQGLQQGQGQGQGQMQGLQQGLGQGQGLQQGQGQGQMQGLGQQQGQSQGQIDPRIIAQIQRQQLLQQQQLLAQLHANQGANDGDQQNIASA